ncbi:MAG: hypothetical protein ACOYD0_10035 [Candidatus Nanopelagicales bacterium]
MVRFLIATGIRLLANAIGLIVAALILDGMSITGAGFVIGVAIFTGSEVLFEPLLTKMAIKNVPALRGGIALVTTFVGLIVTVVISNIFDLNAITISGVSTWFLATMIVWIAALLAGIILPIFLVKKAVDERRDDGTPA